MSYETDIRCARLRAALACVIVVAILAALCLALMGCDTAKADTPQPERGTGQPLDVCIYDAPEYWQECMGVTKVTDTRTDQSWWVLRINRSTLGNDVEADSYVVLPVEKATG